jgi:hypothetical protein
MKKKGLIFRIILMSWIIISSCAAIHLYTIGDVRQVFGESTGQSVPLTTEQSGNNTTVEALPTRYEVWYQSQKNLQPFIK